MDTPNLPTDSLYKMLTIGGVVMFFGAFALSWKANNSLDLAFQRSMESMVRFEQATIGASKTLARLKVDIEGLISEIADEFENKNGLVAQEWQIVSPVPNLSTLNTEKVKLSEFFKNARVVTESLQGSTEETRGIVRRLRLLELAEKHSKALSSIVSEVDRLEAKQELVSNAFVDLQTIDVSADNATLSARRTFRSAIVLLLVGAAVFLHACLNWYQQLQRYQDAIIRCEALKKECIVDSTFDKKGSWFGIYVRLVILVFLSFVIALVLEYFGYLP